MSSFDRLFELLEKTVDEYVNYIVDNFIVGKDTINKIFSILGKYREITYFSPTLIADEILDTYLEGRRPIICKSFGGLNFNLVLPRLNIKNRSIELKLALADLGSCISALFGILHVWADLYHRRLFSKIRQYIYIITDPEETRILGLTYDRRTIIGVLEKPTSPFTQYEINIFTTSIYGILDVPLLYYPSINLSILEPDRRAIDEWARNIEYIDKILKILNVPYKFERVLHERYTYESEIIELIYDIVLSFQLKYRKLIEYIRRILLLLYQLDRIHDRYYTTLFQGKETYYTLLIGTRSILNTLSPIHGLPILNEINKIVTYLISRYR